MQNKKGGTSLIILFIIVIVFVGLVVYTLVSPRQESNLNLKDEKGELSELNKENIMNKNTNERKLQDFTPMVNVEKLEKIDIVLGSGKEVKPGDTVSVHYTGAVVSNGVIFQSSKDFGTEPITFPLSNVISGWTEGIPGMKIGGTRRLIIPSDMAYGATPPPNSGIPANAALVFDVELINIQ